MSFHSLYNYLIEDLAEPVTRGWPLIDTPFIVTFITAVYLYFVLYAGPRYMKNRPPFNLRIFILFYNLFQILANAWIVKSHISAGWFTEFSIICNKNNNDPFSPNGFKVLTICWWILILKLIDYVETCVFVLRKKQNQVSTLHVYHHVSVVIVGWYSLKYTADPNLTLAPMINCAVHAVMYIYYFIAAWSTEMQQIVSPIKPYITKMQMVQFIAVILLGAQMFLDPKCKVRNVKRTLTLLLVVFLYLLVFLYLFYDFYKKTYGNKQKQKSAQHKK